MAKHTVGVSTHNKFFGTDGVAVTATVGNITADACVTGSPSSGPTGGGLSADSATRPERFAFTLTSCEFQRF